MSKLAKDKGLTLVSLVITIIVLLVLSTIAYHTGKGTINNSRLTAYTAEMTVMQQKVNELAQEYKNGDQDTKSRINSLGTAVPAEKAQEASTAFNGANIPQEDRAGYKYYSQETLEELGIDNIEHDFLVNIQKRSIVSLKGIDYQGTTYYEASDLPNGQYNVEEEDISSTTTFTLSIDVQNGMKIKVNDIHYSGNVKAGTVYYGLVQGGQVSKWTKASDQISSTSYSFDVLQEGTYSVKIIDTAGNESDAQSITVNVVNFEVAETGEKFVTLGDAVNKAENNQTVKQIRNYTDSSEVTVDGKSITYDGNGRTLTKTTSSITLDSGSTFNIIGNGIIETTENLHVINAYGGSTLNISGKGIIKSSATDCTISLGTSENSGTNGYLSITEGIIETSNGCGIIANQSSTVNISGGSILTKTDLIIGTTTRTNAVVLNNNSNLTMSNGKIECYTGIRVGNASTCSITGGTINAERNAVSSYSSGKTTITGGILKGGNIEKNYNNPPVYSGSSGTLEIGGTVEIHAEMNAGVYVDGPGETVITGGTITSKSYGVVAKNAGLTTIGNKDDELSTSNPLIQSYHIAMYTNNCSWRFYNGILKSEVRVHSHEPNEMRDHHIIANSTETIDGKTYKTAYLERLRSYTVTFNKNDSGATGQMEPQEIIYDRAEKLATNTFKKDNYSFNEWNTQPDGNGTSYEDEEEVTNLGNITLYAQWTTKKAKVNGQLFDTLQKAIEAVPTDGTQTTVTLLCDTSEVLQVDSGKNIVFDFKNFTVSNFGTNNVFKNSGTILIQNGTISTSVAQGAINNYKNLTMTGGKIIATGNPKQAIYNDDDNAVVEITGDAYLESNGADRATVHNNKGTLYITGGTIVSNRFSAVKNSATMRIGIKDGNINKTSPVLQGGKYGIDSDGKQFELYDGIIKGINAAIDNENNVPAEKREPDCGILHKKEKIDAKIYDVAYTAIGRNITFDPNEGETSEDVRGAECGEPIGTLPRAYKSEYGFVGWFTLRDGGEQITANTIMGNQDVTYYAHYEDTDAAEMNGVTYRTVNSAVAAAPDNVKTTVTLLRNSDEVVTVATSKNIEFDLQDYTLSNYFTAGSTGNIPIINNIGTSLIQNGTIETGAEKVAAINNTGNLTITGGKIVSTGDRQAIYNDGGTTKISGSAYLESCATERATVHNLNAGRLTITGGTIVSINQQALTTVGNCTTTIGLDDGVIDITSPVFQGKTFGATNITDKNVGPTFNFYDGIFKGISSAINSSSETTTNYETGAEPVDDTEYIEGVEYKTTYLQPSRGLLSMFSRRPTIVGTNSITIALNTLVEGANSRTATIEYDSSIISNKKAGFGSTLAEAINNANEETATTVTVTGSGYVYAEGIDSEGNTIASSLQVE